MKIKILQENIKPLRDGAGGLVGCRYLGFSFELSDKLPTIDWEVAPPPMGTGDAYANRSGLICDLEELIRYRVAEMSAHQRLTFFAETQAAS